jgi:hypothetical protein
MLLIVPSDRLMELDVREKIPRGLNKEDRSSISRRLHRTKNPPLPRFKTEKKDVRVIVLALRSSIFRVCLLFPAFLHAAVSYT